jgi:hypothetical protein
MFTEYVTTDVGSLEGLQVVRYQETLAHHGIDSLDVATGKKNNLAYVCLRCQSIGECGTPEARDAFVDNYDVQCCGVTVVFHSSHAVLVDPAKLTLVKVVN